MTTNDQLLPTSQLRRPITDGERVACVLAPPGKCISCGCVTSFHAIKHAQPVPMCGFCQHERRLNP